MKAIVVYPNGQIAQKDLRGYQGIKWELNGGYLQALHVGEDFVCYIDEDGKAKDLRLNTVATFAVELMLGQLKRQLQAKDYISGPAVFVGVKPSPNPEEGIVECDLPEEVIQTYFAAALEGQS